MHRRVNNQYASSSHFGGQRAESPHASSPHLGGQRANNQYPGNSVLSLILSTVVAILTVVLACFALGALQTPPRQLAAEPDARGNRVTGLYSQTDDRFIGPTQIAFTSGAIYEGDLEGHRFNGHGILRGETVNEAGERMVWRFEGQFVDGHLEGEGSYLDHLGTYAGTFSNSQPQGYGIYSSNSGWRYEGEFKAGAMTGEGTVYTADGNATTGRFEDGLQVSIE